MKSVYTLVDDIYKLMETKEVAEGVDLEAAIDLFGENVKDLMRKEFGEKRSDNRKLRMSNIGREDRYLWNVYNDVEKADDIQGHTYVKFLYGHLIEEMLLFLTRAAGHEVTDEQKSVKLTALQVRWTVKSTVLLLTLRVCQLMGLGNSKMVHWLMTTHLATWLKLKDTHIQKVLLNLDG